MIIPVHNGDAPELSIVFEGEAIRVRAHLNVAAALLEAGVTRFRETPVSGAPRAPFCMMGVCFDCLLIIDGVANQQACMTPVREGMRIERQLSTAADMTASRDDRPAEKPA